MKLMVVLIFSLLITSGCDFASSTTTTNSGNTTSTPDDDLETGSQGQGGGSGGNPPPLTQKQKRDNKFNAILKKAETNHYFESEDNFQELRQYVRYGDYAFLSAQQKDSLKTALIGDGKITQVNADKHTFLNILFAGYDNLAQLKQDNVAPKVKPDAGKKSAAGDAPKPAAEPLNVASTKTAEEVVDTLVNPDDIIDPSLLYEVQTYLKGENKATRALELIDAGLLGKVFDSANFVDEMGLPSTINSLGIIKELDVNDNTLKTRIINEIKSNKYIEKLTIDDDTKAVFFELLPENIKNYLEIKEQIAKVMEPIKIKNLIKSPTLAAAQVTNFLNINSKNNAEKEELAKKLIDEELLNKVFNFSNQDILEDNKLAFNDDVKNKIIEKIKSDKIIEGIFYKNYKNGNQSEFLFRLGKLPDYLLNNADILEQIKVGIDKNLKYDGGFEAIYTELIQPNVINDQVKNLALTAMGLFFDDILKRDNKQTLINKNYVINTLLPLIKTKSTKSNFLLLQSLENKFKNSESKILFCKTLFDTVLREYKGKQVNLNLDFKNDKDNLKEYITYAVVNMPDDFKNKQKDNINSMKALGLLDN